MVTLDAAVSIRPVPPIRVAMLSYWHVHAGDHAAAARLHPDTEVVAVWDDDDARGRIAAEGLGVDHHSELADVLARTDVDAVIVNAPTAQHVPVITAAARAGKHVFTEKLLALTVEGCDQILDATREAGIALVVSLPMLSRGHLQAIRRVIDEDRIGQVTLARIRLSHDGGTGERWNLPEHFYDPLTCGGGSMIDLGAHPLYLAAAILGGLPQSVTATYGRVTGRHVEDNAVAVLSYPDGALGIVETGFVSWAPLLIEVHGTRGSLFFGLTDDRLLLGTATPDLTTDFEEVGLPSDLPSPFDQWVGHMRDGTQASDNHRRAVEVTRMAVAANQSAATGAAIIVTPAARRDESLA